MSLEMLPCFHRSGLKTTCAETKSYSRHTSSKLNSEMASEWIVSLTKPDLCQSINRFKKKKSNKISRKMENTNYWALSLVAILSNFEGLNLHENFNVLTKFRSFARSFWGLTCYQECKQKDLMPFLT